jgi:hypothetical protein
MYAKVLPLRYLNEQQQKALEYFYSPSGMGLWLSVFLPITIGVCAIGVFTGFIIGLAVGVGVSVLLIVLRVWNARRRLARVKEVYEYGDEQKLYFNNISNNYSIKVNGAPQQVISLTLGHEPLTIKTFSAKVISVYSIPEQKAYVHPEYKGTVVPAGIFLLNVPPKKSVGKRIRSGFFLLIPLAFVFGLVYFIHSVLASYSYTHLQPDAIVYRVNNKLVLASVVTHFEANSAGSKGVFGSDNYYAAGFDMQTGKRLWKVNFHARNEQGNDAGSAQLLGQSDKYLFFLRNELYVIDKLNGDVVARNDHFPDLKDKLSKSAVAGYDDDATYTYSDSLHAVVIKGTDGLFYTIDGNTLQTGTTDISDPDTYFRNHWKYGNNYSDWIASLNDDGVHCITLLDNQDTTLLAHNPEAFESRSADKSIRRYLYSCPSNDRQADWTWLNPSVFIYGGFLVEVDKARIQPADSLANLRAFDDLLQRYNADNTPVRTADDGFLILHKKTIEPGADLLLTGVSAIGKTLWQINTGYTGLPVMYHDNVNNILYLAGNAKRSSSDDIDQLTKIDLKTGEVNKYTLE